MYCLKSQFLLDIFISYLIKTWVKFFFSIVLRNISFLKLNWIGKGLVGLHDLEVACLQLTNCSRTFCCQPKKYFLTLSKKAWYRLYLLFNSWISSFPWYNKTVPLNIYWCFLEKRILNPNQWCYMNTEMWYLLKLDSEISVWWAEAGSIYGKSTCDDNQRIFFWWPFLVFPTSKTSTLIFLLLPHFVSLPLPHTHSLCVPEAYCWLPLNGV